MDKRPAASESISVKRESVRVSDATAGKLARSLAAASMLASALMIRSTPGMRRGLAGDAQRTRDKTRRKVRNRMARASRRANRAR